MTVSTGPNAIQIRGARTHNLRGIDVDIPLGKLVVVTGISGSGKSSLAFDTLFAEGQRRYLESVSVHTRTLLNQLPRPQVDEIIGLPPTVSVDQRVNAVPARSTLAMTTEIYDYLRLLYARAGIAHCTGCGQPVTSQTVGQIVDRVLQHPERTKLMILSPMVRDRRGAHRDVLDRIERNGFVRVRVDGELLDVCSVPELTVNKRHSIDAIIDRIIIKDGIEQRLRESVELAVRESDGNCIICTQTDGEWQDALFSTRFSCADCNLSFQTPEPRTFSFNSTWGACPDCEGFGIRGVADDSSDITVFRQSACESCGGDRLQPFARSITFGGMTIGECTSQSVEQALHCVTSWLENLNFSAANDPKHRAEHTLVARRTLPDIKTRLECLQQVGLGYLTLNRPTRTLSGGEFQRARLAACLGTGLHGACFVLDEPTSGLHPRDTRKLLELLTAIRDSGATVVVVEHDPEIMQAADHLIDLGPGAGQEGGHLLFSGDVQYATETNSPTGQCLRGQIKHGMAFDKQPAPDMDAPAPASAKITIRNARQNNLQNLSVQIPLRQMVCVTGVSGSGKSSLIMDTLLPVATAFLQSPDRQVLAAADAECDGVDGLAEITRVVAVDNSPPGRNRRSCIATYSGIWNEVRKILGRTREARARGFTARRFSFNSGDGRCVECKGTGERDIRMPLLPDATIPCPACSGQRFNRSTLSVRFNGHNAADILNLRVDEAVGYFSEFSRLHDIMDTFRQVGLGYLTLGQPASTFSGGESQRVKLATELTSSRSGETLFILDEPTSGLHPADVAQLTTLLRNLVIAGHSVVVVEHNVDVMLASDWLIDIGPESAADGGRIVAAGPPSRIAGTPESHTAAFLTTGKSGRY